MVATAWLGKKRTAHEGACKRDSPMTTFVIALLILILDKAWDEVRRWINGRRRKLNVIKPEGGTTLKVAQHQIAPTINHRRRPSH
jgi:hypothetical protein